MVPLSSTFRVHAEVGYEDFEGNNLDYSWKIDQGDFVQYSAFDGLNITTLGISNNLRTEQAILDVTFSPTIVSSGSFVTIRINDQGTLTRQLIFEVE